MLPIELSKIAAVILAGGRSSRMGTNKALLPYNGARLIDHMVRVLGDAGFKNCFISGDIEGYSSVPDPIAFQGPAKAIIHMTEYLNEFNDFLFIPVDMPLITSEVLFHLLEQEKSTYYEKHFFPMFLKKPISKKSIYSIKDIIKSNNISSLKVPEKYKDKLSNINTPDNYFNI